jgi:hypothetical protein
MESKATTASRPAIRAAWFCRNHHTALPAQGSAADDIEELWGGLAAAAQDHGYA